MKRFILIVLSLLVPAALLLPSCQSPAGSKTAALPRAAIIDQLYVLEPNVELVAKATEMLESCGFQVDVWQGKDITVDFYRELPRHGYKLIIFRVHSGILLEVQGSQLIPSKTTYLFTGENYTTNRYVAEQLADKVSNALMSDNYPLVFALNSRFVTDDFKGGFRDTVILSMGCESYYLDDMAEAFLKKGASVYLGWSTVVSLEYVDRATLELLKNLCVDKMMVAQGIAKTMADVGTDPYFHAYLKYSPLRNGDKTIQELAR